MLLTKISVVNASIAFTFFGRISAPIVRRTTGIVSCHFTLSYLSVWSKEASPTSPVISERKGVRSVTRNIANIQWVLRIFFNKISYTNQYPLPTLYPVPIFYHCHSLSPTPPTVFQENNPHTELHSTTVFHGFR